VRAVRGRHAAARADNRLNPPRASDLSMPAERIDVHTHIIPATWPDFRAKFGYGGWPRIEHTAPRRARMAIDAHFFREIEDNCWDPAVRLDECDAAGVSLQVLSTIPVMFSYWAPAPAALEMARLLNDHLAGIVASHPDRFAGLGTVPLQEPDLAIAELERCVRELGMTGIQIGSHVAERNLDDPGIVAVLEAAEALDAAVFVHPWDMLSPERMTRYWFPWLVGMPAELALAIGSVILGGVLDRLPRLRLMFAHGGGAFPGILGRIEAGFRARPDLVATATETDPRTQILRITVDSLVHDPAAFRYLLDLLGPERIALGTDYPFPLGEIQPGVLIDSIAELTPAARAELFAGTANRFLGRARVAQAILSAPVPPP
jgi:aminocarboxymuconate-semialdehyde decarboxylase